MIVKEQVESWRGKMRTKEGEKVEVLDGGTQKVAERLSCELWTYAELWKLVHPSRTLVRMRIFHEQDLRRLSIRQFWFRKLSFPLQLQFFILWGEWKHLSAAQTVNMEKVWKRKIDKIRDLIWFDCAAGECDVRVCAFLANELTSECCLSGVSIWIEIFDSMDNVKFHAIIYCRRQYRNFSTFFLFLFRFSLGSFKDSSISP